MKTNKGKYKPGDVVWLHHTQEKGIVLDFVDMFILKVAVDDLELPVFIEDLEFYTKQDLLGENHESIPDSKDTQVVLNEAELYFQKYGAEIASGFYLAFQPIETDDGPAFFEMILVNDTNDEVQFDVQLYLNNELYMHLKNRLARRYIYPMGDLAYDELNENPEIRIRIEHRSHPLFQLEKVLKMRPKSFFKDLSSTPILEASAYNFKLGYLQEINTLQSKEVTITPTLTKRIEKRINENFKAPIAAKHEHFYIPDVVDLHIEALLNNHRGLTNGEILKIQLQHFKKCLDDAIVHRLHKLTVIHGIGSGKLRQEIWNQLKQVAAVRSYNNDYHPRYGFGATEIYFR